MTVEPRAALDRLFAALEAHLNAVVGRHDADDPAVDDAYDVLADAIEAYDEALARTHGESLPFFSDDDDDDDDLDDEDDDLDEDDLDDEDDDDLDDDDLDDDELDEDDLDDTADEDA